MKKNISCPKVSIIITTYKRTYFFQKALLSAIHQDYENKEIIVIDDNNKNSPEHIYVLSVIQKYPNIIYYSNEKKIGPSLSRNKGIELCNGELVAFLDDDDVWFKKKISEQVTCYNGKKNNNVGLIYCDVQDIDENGIKLKTLRRKYEGKVLFEHMAYFIATTSTWLCCKNVLLEIGCFDDVPSQQDSFLLLKMLSRGYEIYRVPKVLMYFRRGHSGRITTINYEYIENLKKYQEECKKYFYLITDEERKIVEFYFEKKLFDLYFYSLNDYNKSKEKLDNMKTKYLNDETYSVYKESKEKFMCLLQ